MKKKVLLIVGKLYIGGAEKVTRDIALYADPHRFEFHYVVFDDEVGAYEPQLEAIGCKIIHLSKPSAGYSAYMRNLRSLMRKHQYQAVHVHTMFNCGWAMLAAKLERIPVRISHAHSALRNGGGFVKTVYEKAMRFLILHCSTDLAACGVEAGHRLFGKKAFEKRGQLILNGIDIPAFAYDPEKRNKIRNALNAENCLILGHAGHLAEVKNQSFLLDLMPKVLEKRPDAKLLLLGEGEDRPMLERRIREMRLEDCVIMTGNVTNVADYLSAMDVFVFPSLYEGTPLSILEVQANGLPCVISDRVPEDVFLTDLLHPLSLNDPKEKWADTILNLQRADAGTYNRMLRNSDYAVETAMEKIYHIYEKGQPDD